MNAKQRRHAHKQEVRSIEFQRMSRSYEDLERRAAQSEEWQIEVEAQRAALLQADADLKKFSEQVAERDARISQLVADERDLAKLRRRLADKQRELDEAHTENQRLRSELLRGRSLVSAL